MRQPKEIPYFELEGQMDLETDFPEILPGTPAAPTVVQQPATIQTTMTLEEMMGGDEPEEQPEKLSAYGTPKRVYADGSLLDEPSCEGGHYCFSCAEMDCEIRGKERQCWYAPCGNPFPCEIVVDRPLDLLTEQMGDRCQFVNQDLAYHCAGTGEAAPCCSRCENPCEWACERATAEKESQRLLRRRNRKHHHRFWRPLLCHWNPLPKSSALGSACIIRCMTVAWQMRTRLSLEPVKIAQIVVAGSVRSMETADWSATLQNGGKCLRVMPIRKRRQSLCRSMIGNY